MNIAVLGAGGRTGIEFVKAALAAGHEVRAGIHHANPFSLQPRLVVMTCDAMSIDEVSRLIEGCTVVVSLIGHVKGSPADVQTKSIDTIMTAMKKQNIARLISLTGTGVRFEGDHITAIDRFLNASVALIDPNRIKDGQVHVDHIKASSLDWTILRVLKLQNIQPKPFTLTEHGPTKVIVGRHEVAQALIEIITQYSFIHQAPMLTKR